MEQNIDLVGRWLKPASDLLGISKLKQMSVGDDHECRFDFRVHVEYWIFLRFWLQTRACGTHWIGEYV